MSADNHTLRARTIALAGLFQAVQLVQNTARGRMRDRATTRASITSIFATDAASVTAVYGDLTGLCTGLEVLVGQLGNTRSRRDLDLTGHVITLLHLERKLTHDRTMMERLASGIRQAQQTVDTSGEPGPAVLAVLAELYQQTISTLSPRILVRGEPAILTSHEARQVIRSLLLAGIRAAVLWRQCGGTRWRLVLERRGMLDCAKNLLQESRRGQG
jgi:high frequency lysogenization protein